MVLDHTQPKRRLRRNSGNSRGDGDERGWGKKEAEGAIGLWRGFSGYSRLPEEAVQDLPFFCFPEVHKSLRHIYEQKKVINPVTSPCPQAKARLLVCSQSAVGAAAHRLPLCLVPPPQGLPALASRQCPPPRSTGRQENGVGPSQRPGEGEVLPQET